MSYAQTNQTMKTIFIASVFKFPKRYVQSVFADLRRLFFVTSEYYPNPEVLIGLPYNPKRELPKWSVPLIRFARGIIHPTSYFLFIALFVWLLIFYMTKTRGSIRIRHEWIILFSFLFYGYLLTAAVEIGFTRYTLPWLPIRAILLSQAVFYLIFFLEVTIKKIPGLKRARI
jgi:hypothetical protein